MIRLDFFLSRDFCVGLPKYIVCAKLQSGFCGEEQKLSNAYKILRL